MTLKSLFPSVVISILIATLASACKADAVEIPIPKPITNPVTTTDSTGLRDVSPYPFGAALNVPTLKNNTLYSNTVIREFNSITAENAMKMKSISLGRGQYKWDDADFLVGFAAKNKMRVHGHALIWYKSTPTWIENFSGTKEEWKAIMREYILAVVGRYKGKIESWDVLNEAILDNGTLRDCVWLQHIGPEYMDLCFQYAHEADPNAILFYNDYGHEYGPTKRTAINNLVTEMKSRNVPIHGIGLQMHTSISRSNADIQKAISVAASTGLKVHVSEFDIRINTAENLSLTYNATLAAAQKEKYQVAVKALTSLPASQRFGFTFWGVHDAQSWIPSHYGFPDWPLPFDNDFKRKEAYYGILKGLE
jgi:endo-1,4-beta-xylanase